MKMKQNVRDLFNSQIKFEYESAFLYLSMSQWLNENDFPGAANWMEIQYREELVHAEGLFHYLAMRGETIELLECAKPKHSWDSLLEVFTEAYQHEQLITSKISDLAQVADEAGDRAAVLFLDWYVLEQVEEEFNAKENVVSIKRAGDSSTDLLALDKDWAGRTFQAAIIPHIN